jgi:tetratricopeptide (TPR) repeat protein
MDELSAALAVHRQGGGLGLARCLSYVGYVQLTGGDSGGAIVTYRENLEVCQRLLGEGHPHTLVARQNLARALFAAGDQPAAVEAFGAVAESYRRAFGAHAATAAALQDWARVMMEAGDLAGAERVAGELLAMRRGLSPGDDAGVAAAHELLGRIGLRQDRPEAALASLRDAEAMLGRLGAGAAADRGAVLRVIGEACAQHGDLEAARAALVAAVDAGRGAEPADASELAAALRALADVEERRGEPALARSAWQEAQALATGAR